MNNETDKTKIMYQFYLALNVGSKGINTFGKNFRDARSTTFAKTLGFEKLRFKSKKHNMILKAIMERWYEKYVLEL